MMKSTWMRWVVCSLAVMAMLALLGGCAKKESGEATTETTETETATETTAPAAAGTYTAPLANGTASLMLNPDMSASFSLQVMPDAPAQVENGNWTASATGVDVTFTRAGADTSMTQSVTLNFAANGDTLALTNGDAIGMPGLKMTKQH